MIRDRLLAQKRELEQKLTQYYIERDINKNIDNDLIKVIIGPRRAGKSFYAMHILKSHKNYGYINFEDESLINLKDYDEIISEINSVYDNPKTIFLDEIQNLPKWELFVNRLQRQGYNIILSGSNSKLLSKELATHLTGRHIPIILFPFSFKEYVHSKELTTQEKISIAMDYILKGGFPEPLIKNISYNEYLTTLFDSIIYKDIIKRFSVKNSNAFESIAKMLITNAANEFSYNSLKNTTGVKSSVSVQKYVSYLEEAFLLFQVHRFSFKIKEQISSNKKIYCIDNGFINAVGFAASPNIGKLTENIVAIALKKRELERKISFYYYKTSNGEVDFVIKEGTKIIQLIQVCHSLKEEKTLNREIRALLHASEQLKCKNLIIINSEIDDVKEHEWYGKKNRIRYIPLWKWLLKN